MYGGDFYPTHIHDLIMPVVKANLFWTDEQIAADVNTRLGAGDKPLTGSDVRCVADHHGWFRERPNQDLVD